ncbi:MAG: transcriptional regulator BolA [Pseudomonadota bacterium]
MSTENTIRKKLEIAFSPQQLSVINESHKHNVPAGSESHFKVLIVSDAFEGKRLLQRHRSVNAELAHELSSGVHALSLHTKTPDEWAASQNTIPTSPPCMGGDGNASS